MSTLKKIAALALAGCVVCGSVFAASSEEKAAEKSRKAAARNEKVVADTVLFAEIIGYESGNVYILEEGNGNTVRADLGKNGGRLWRLTPMKFSGAFVQDSRGRLFKMTRVDYKDPKDGDKHLRGEGRMAVRNLKRDGDPALYHPDQVPTDNSSYITQNLAGVTDLSQYTEMNVMELNQAASGTKAAVIGRPVETVSPDKVMKFWDRDNNPFYVLMNGGFIPLGQRAFLYGTVRRGSDNVTYLSLEQVDSIQ